METQLGELLTRWTVRVAVGCYVVHVTTELFSPHNSNLKHAKCSGWDRWNWTIGCFFYLLHVGFAFYFYHHWSHQEAYRHTAERTAEVIGISWGGGLYFNYLLTVVWVSDVVARWSYNSTKPNLPGWWRRTVHGFFAVMMLSATVVFGPEFWKWFAVGVVVVWTGLFFRKKQARDPL